MAANPASCEESGALIARTNLWGVIYGVKEFLPLLRQRLEGHIVSVSKYAIAGLSWCLP